MERRRNTQPYQGRHTASRLARAERSSELPDLALKSKFRTDL